MSDDTPIMDGSNGRRPDGTFAPGNAFGTGCPRGRRIRDLRERLDDALCTVCTPNRLVNVVDAILKLAESGDIGAAKLLFERIAPLRIAELAERLDGVEEKLIFNRITFDGDREAKSED